MRTPSRLTIHLVLALVISMCVFGCGGGGETSSTSPVVSPSAPVVLNWSPPQSFADQTALDPARDLDHYEIYIKESGNFGSTDLSTATVSAVDRANGDLITSFDLAKLGDFLTKNVTYYVSMKSVSVTGVKSDFSPSASFSL